MRSKSNFCHCPICEWEGLIWEEVECKPGAFINKKCPTCGSYPRDRLTWILLRDYAERVAPKKLRVIEVGASRWTYHWKKKHYFYRNTDLPPASSIVDLYIDDDGRIANPPGNFHIAIISYVLSMVEDEAIRIFLLRQLNDVTVATGTLILFDDILLTQGQHSRVEHDEYFHKLRLGTPLLDEIEKANWKPAIVSSLPEDGTMARTELPFMICQKQPMVQRETLK